MVRITVVKIVIRSVVDCSSMIVPVSIETFRLETEVCELVVLILVKLLLRLLVCDLLQLLSVAMRFAIIGCRSRDTTVVLTFLLSLLSLSFPLISFPFFSNNELDFDTLLHGPGSDVYLFVATRKRETARTGRRKVGDPSGAF